MTNLTDELKIINASIIFASENDLDYLILRCPTNINLKKVEINLGKGILFKKPEIFFGADFCIKKGGNLEYNQIHVWPLDNNYRKETEKYRQYLEKEFPDFQFKY